MGEGWGKYTFLRFLKDPSISGNSPKFEEKNDNKSIFTNPPMTVHKQYRNFATQPILSNQLELHLKKIKKDPSK